MLASPVKVIHETDPEKTAAQISEIAAEEKVSRIIVGNPLNMNGSCGPRAEICAEFAALVGETSGIETLLWDERSTTVSAARYLNEVDVRGKKRKNIVDAVAATIILENYLQYRKNHRDTQPL